MGRAPKGGASLSVTVLTELRHVNGAATKLCGRTIHFEAVHVGRRRRNGRRRGLRCRGHARTGADITPAMLAHIAFLRENESPAAALRRRSAKMLRNKKMPPN